MSSVFCVSKMPRNQLGFVQCLTETSYAYTVFMIDRQHILETEIHNVCPDGSETFYGWELTIRVLDQFTKVLASEMEGAKSELKEYIGKGTKVKTEGVDPSGADSGDEGSADADAEDSVVIVDDDSGLSFFSLFKYDWEDLKERHGAPPASFSPYAGAQGLFFIVAMAAMNPFGTNECHKVHHFLSAIRGSPEEKESRRQWHIYISSMAQILFADAEDDVSFALFPIVSDLGLLFSNTIVCCCCASWFATPMMRRRS